MTKEKIRVKLRGFDVELIDQSSKAIVQTVQKAGARVSGPIPLPTRINKVTVLRSPHVNKKAREQFEMRTHKRLIDIIEPSAEVMDSLMKLEGRRSPGSGDDVPKECDQNERSDSKENRHDPGF